MTDETSIDSHSIAAVMQAYAVTQEQVRTALGYAAERVAAETVYVISDR